MAAGLVNVAPGQCRLVRDSSTQISLQRFRGKWLPIKLSADWIAHEIPATAPVLANTGLTAATLYYIYAYDSSDTLTLEASTTAYAVDADTGVYIKSGDATRTLVGMVYMGAGSPGTFVDSATQRFVRSWFNRARAETINHFTATRSTTSGTYVELNSEIRIEMINWADENIHLEVSGLCNNTSTFYTRIGEGATPTYVSGGTATTTGTNGHGNTSFTAILRNPSEGYRYFSLWGRTDGGSNGLWQGGAETAEGVVQLRGWMQED